MKPNIKDTQVFKKTFNGQDHLLENKCFENSFRGKTWNLFWSISDSTVSPRNDTLQGERISFFLHVHLVCLKSVWRIHTPFLLVMFFVFFTFPSKCIKLLKITVYCNYPCWKIFRNQLYFSCSMVFSRSTDTYITSSYWSLRFKFRSPTDHWRW